MATTLNITGLTEYVAQKRDELIVKAAAGSRSLDFIDLYPGVKHKEAIHFLDSEVEAQDGSSCGFSPNGSDTFSDKTIEVKLVKYEKSWCYKDFKEKFMNYQLQWEAGRQTLPFEEKLAESNLNAIHDANEDMIWNGNSGLSISGVVELVSASTAVSAVTFSTGNTIIEKVDTMVASIPNRAFKVGAPVYLFMSETDFRAYIKALNDTCCANIPIIDAANDTIKYPGDSRVTLVPIAALEGQGVMIASPKSEIIYGTDIEDADAVYRLWFNEETEKFNFRVLFAMGVALRYEDLIVLGA